MVGSNLQALILDYGEVLSHPQRVEVVRRLAHGVGVSVDQFTAAYLQHRVEYHKALFVDDRIENLEGAARLGLRVFRFFGDGAVNQLRTVLQASIDTDPSTKRVSQKPIR